MPDQKLELYRQFGANVAAVRNRLGMVQADLARAVNLSRTSIANIEAGRQHIQIHLAYDIARALNLDVAELLPAIGSNRERMDVSDAVAATLNRDRWMQKIKQNASGT